MWCLIIAVFPIRKTALRVRARKIYAGLICDYAWRRVQLPRSNCHNEITWRVKASGTRNVGTSAKGKYVNSSGVGVV